jgi:hypothetical protein
MSGLFAVIIAAMATWNGYWLVGRVAPRLEQRERLSFGAVLGLAGLAWLGFIPALLLSLAGFPGFAPVIGLVTAVLVIGLVWQWKLAGAGFSPSLRPNLSIKWRRPRLPELKIIGWYSSWVFFLVWIFWRVIDTGEGGITTSPANNYGDLAFHLNVIESFAYGENLPPRNPIFAGLSFTYPFLIDFLTAFFLRCGAELRMAFLIENLILGLALFGIIESLGRRLTGQMRAGRIGLLLFVFSGGLGFLKFGEDLRRFIADPTARRMGLFWFFSNLPASYTINNTVSLAGVEVPLRYGNLLTTMLIPQRSLLFGLPVVGMIVLLWHLSLSDEERRESWWEMGLAGVLAGLLPLLHAHGFFAVMIVSLPLMLVYRRKEWVAYFIPVAVLAGPQALWLSRTAVRSSIFTPHRWWEAGTTNPALFWLANNGIFLIVLWVMFLLLWWQRERLAPFYLPFWLWLIVPNLVLLAPWPWDNIKMLVYWGMVSSVVVGYAVSRLIGNRVWLVRAGGVALLAVLLASGLLDVWRGLSPVERVPLFSADDLRIAERIRDVTPARSVILHAAIHNSPVALTGRQSVMGYPGHLWSHGIDYQSREDDVRSILTFRAGAAELLARYGVDYVLIGTAELTQFAADESAFLARYPIVFEDAGTRLYRVR